MQVARKRLCRIVTAVFGAEHAYVDVVGAVANAERVKRLMQVADQVDQEFQRRRTVSAIERAVRGALFPVGDALHRAVAPPIGAAVFFHAGLARAIAITIVALRVGRDVEVVPRRGLHLVGRE